jgi:AbrB family looped-hinge helix DNA binding protein
VADQDRLKAKAGIAYNPAPFYRRQTGKAFTVRLAVWTRHSFHLPQVIGHPALTALAFFDILMFRTRVPAMESATLQIAQRGVITIPKAIRDTYGLADGDTLTLLDLGGVFVLAPVRTEIAALADRVAAQWREDGETRETMLQTLREDASMRWSDGNGKSP